MSATTKTQFTDEALELAKLAQLMKGFNPSKEVAVYEMLNQLLNKATLRSHPMLAYYTCAKRADDLIRFVEEVEDDHLDDELKQNAEIAIRSIQAIFLQEKINTNWSHCLRDLIKQEHIVTIKYLSRTVRAHRPLRTVDNQEVSEVVKSLEKAKLEIANSKSIPLWAKAILAEGISAAEFRTNNILFFGYDEVLSSFIDLEATSIAVAESCETKSALKINIMPIIVAVILAKDLFTAPVEIAQAALTYSGWRQVAANYILKSRPDQPKLLPSPPKKEDEKTTKDGNKAKVAAGAKSLIKITPKKATKARINRQN